MWAKFDEFWTRQIDLWHETTMTAAQHGYGVNVSGSQGSEITEAKQAYYESLQEFGKANRDNAATLHQLSQANSSMANNIAADVKSLQQQMAQLLLAINKQTATPTAAMYPPLINAMPMVAVHTKRTLRHHLHNSIRPTNTTNSHPKDMDNNLVREEDMWI